MSSSVAVCLKTNLADYPVTMAMKDGRVTSGLVTLDYCGPKTAHDGFKAMIRENAFDAGELAIVTYLQAKAWGKPFVLLPIPISGRFQHHCIGFNHELGPLNPAAPEFPLAPAAIAPLRAKAESLGRGDFSPLWSGQNASGCKRIPAAQLTHELAAEL